MDFISKNKRWIILFIFLQIIIMSFTWAGYFEQTDFLPGGFELILLLPTIFAVLTLYYNKEKQIGNHNEEIKQFIIYDLIYCGIALLTGIVFIIVVLLISF